MERMVEDRAATNILVLCTHNSARSILGEGMVNQLAGKLRVDVRGFSAGSTPSGQVNPLALKVLAEAGIDVSGFRSKSWDELSRPDAPKMRIVITVCDQAAAEQCPFWPGAPLQAHWGYPDPSRVVGGDEARSAAFELTRQALGYRFMQLLLLPLDTLSDGELRERLRQIARS